MASIRTADLTKNFGDLRAVNEIELDLPTGDGQAHSGRGD
jgi:ABC-type branched-subunit amino acid transport system ATPase component